MLIIYNKKRHEVMCSCPSNLGIGKHLCRNGGYGEHISRLKVCFYPQAGCLRTMHTRQAKAYNAHPPAVILPISDQGQYCNAFLAYNFRSRKSVQRYKHFPTWQNKKRCRRAEGTSARRCDGPSVEKGEKYPFLFRCLNLRDAIVDTGVERDLKAAPLNNHRGVGLQFRV